MHLSDDITATELAADERFQQFCLNPTPEEVNYWHQWQVEKQINEATIEEAKNLVRQLHFYPTQLEEKEELKKLQLSIRKEEHVTKMRSLNRRFWMQVAAAALLLLAVGFAIWNVNTSNALPELISFQTPFGETQKIQLEDGTQIMLNANSSLQHAAQLNYNGQREIWLNGEAYFDVAHRPQEPFIVHTTNGDIRVLGTSFNVIQRPDDFELTLVEGKVQFEQSNAVTIPMQPGEQISILNKELNKIKVDTEGIAAWRNNQMNFRNVSIARVIAQIEYDFGLKIQVNNQALLERKVNAQIPENDPQLLFEALAVIYDLTIKQTAEQEYILE